MHFTRILKINIHTNIKSIYIPIAKIFNKNQQKFWKKVKSGATANHPLPRAFTDTLARCKEVHWKKSISDLMTSMGDRIRILSLVGTTCHVNTSLQSKPPIWGSPEFPRYSKVFQSITSITGHTTADSSSWILQTPRTPCLSKWTGAGGQFGNSGMNSPHPSTRKEEHLCSCFCYSRCLQPCQAGDHLGRCLGEEGEQGFWPSYETPHSFNIRILSMVILTKHIKIKGHF